MAPETAPAQARNQWRTDVVDQRTRYGIPQASSPRPKVPRLDEDTSDHRDKQANRSVKHRLAPFDHPLPRAYALAGLSVSGILRRRSADQWLSGNSSSFA